MATSPDTTVIEKMNRLSMPAQQNVSNFVASALVAHGKMTELQDKMDAIDVAYSRYKLKQKVANGQDIKEASEGCGNIFADDDVVPPIVISQVDSYVAYLADVFLSGTPMFPVVSSPAKRVWAEQLETLLDDHALIGGYARQLLLFLRDGIKYNYSAIETDWDSIDQFSVAGDFSTGTGKRVDRAPKSFTRLKRLNPRNVFRDATIAPGDISEHGDYAGYIERVSRMRVKRELNKLTNLGKVYNADKAINSASSAVNMHNYYRDDPTISNYSGVIDKNAGPDWDTFFDGPQKVGARRGNYGDSYYRIVMYARILPADFGISAPAPNTPQIWKFVHINDHLISAQRIISAYDYLPILFGQPLEDGMGYQTQSVAESEIPFQDAATTLFNIRFASARRAVSDRAIFDPEFLSESDVNSKAAAPKIPARISRLSTKKLSDLYHQIPFDNRGTENTIQDAQTIVNFSKELHGVNNPRTGQFQKGNKSVKEWNDTMDGSDNRTRLPAMILEHQVFSPLKSIMVLNIFQYGDNAVVISQRSGVEYKIDLAQLRKQVLAFRVADGFTPKSKMASVEMITLGFQTISQSPQLQQYYGPMLPSIFAHMMQLGGVRGLEEYDPRNTGEQPVAPPGLDAQSIQGGAQPPVAPPVQPALDPVQQAAVQTPPPMIP